VLDFCPGGDLESLMSSQELPLGEDQARFYLAEILLALKDLHKRDIIYRDLKPDNVVIDDNGHVQLIDFGMAKSNIPDVQKGAQTFCGSVKYLAPEMIRKVGHGQSLDWYLLGVLLYEMIVGVTPYYSTNKEELFDNIVNGKLKLPRNISAEVKSLIIQLLNRNPKKRLGNKPGEQGAEQIMGHPFFKETNW
jgi:serine/threonine protein kinase